MKPSLTSAVARVAPFAALALLTGCAVTPQAPSGASFAAADTTQAGLLSFAAILPEILMVFWGAAVLAADLISGGAIKRKTLGWLAGGGLLFILVISIALRPAVASDVFGGMVRDDLWIWAFRIVFILGGALTCFASIDFKPARAAGEYYALVIFAAMAMSLMAASNDVVMLYLATETASIALYVLAGFMRNNSMSAESGLKYFVFGAVASTLMLYGLSLMYGMAGGQTSYAAVAQALAAPELRTLAVFSSLLVIVGFAFKTSAVPLHFWAPDVYQGAPTPIAGFISTASKAAGFAILLRFLSYVILPDTGAGFASAVGFTWVRLLLPFAMLTLVLGSLSALMQKNVKRMLAYSSIAQAGYMFIGVAAYAASTTQSAREEALASVLFYTATYVLTNVGAFAVVGLVSQRLGGDDYTHFAGLARKSPYLALAMTAALLSLLGAPPMVGFAGKLFLFRSAIGVYQSTGDFNYMLMVVIGVAMVLVSVFYYLAVVKAMFVDRMTQDTKPLYIPLATGVVSVTTGVGVIATLIATGPLFELAVLAARSFLTSGAVTALLQ
jgi:NADH-quinone oxidoreductase subunit N